MHRLTATDTPMVRYTRTIFPPYADLFVLDLSFLGWYFLGFLCFGIGALFVQPYDVAAFTEVYLILKESVKKDECATDIQSD